MNKNEKLALGTLIAILLIGLVIAYFTTSRPHVYIAPTPSPVTEPSPTPKITHCLDVNNNELPMSECAKG